MVGHTGVMQAAIKAVDTIDECLGRLVAAINDAGGFMVLTADHGNIELMKDPETGEPFTAHTTFDVPIVLYGAAKGAKLQDGRLADIAPTILALMGLAQPQAMTGHSLLVGAPAKRKTPEREISSSARGAGRRHVCRGRACPGAGPAHAPSALKTDAPPSSKDQEPAIDLSHALPGESLKGLPSSQEQLGTLKAELAKDRPAVAGAKEKKPDAGGPGGGTAPEIDRHRRPGSGAGTRAEHVDQPDCGTSGRGRCAGGRFCPRPHIGDAAAGDPGKAAT